MQPLVREIACERVRARIGEHSLHLLLAHGRIVERAVDRELQQLVVGHRVPQEERQLRGEIHAVYPIRLPGCQASRHVLGAIQEERAREDTGDRATDPFFETAALQAVAVVLHDLCDVELGEPSPVRSPSDQ